MAGCALPMPRNLLAVFVVVAVLAAGCADDDDGGGDDDSGGGGGAATTSQAAPAETTAAPTTAVATTAPASTGAATSPTTTAPAPTATQPPVPDLEAVQVTVAEIATAEQPLDVVTGPDGALYIAEKTGGVLRLGEDGATGTWFDLSDRVSGGSEQGLLGLAFLEGRFYASYTDEAGTSTLASWALSGSGQPDPATEQVVLTVPQPFANHNGGGLAVGPDGLLYWGLGDGGSGGDPEENGQNRGTLLGAILRIRPTPDGPEPYEIPEDNPFAGEEGAAGEIWVWGLRNPWRFSFDAATGDLWIGDVGQDSIEEIDLLPAGQAAGANMGWNAFEGTEVFDGEEPASETVPPVFQYGHDEGVSVTGGYVYRGAAIPELQGAYVFADFAAGWVDAITVVDGQTTARVRLAEPGSVSSFGVDPAGELLITSLEGGIYRLVPA
jgi:glucose/arabinose dehydrogenase